MPSHGKALISQFAPANGVEFELTLDAIDPMEMVKGDGHNPEGWKFTGSKVVPQTRMFKLVDVGFCVTFYGVRAKLVKYGSIPEGQWREAFKKAFPKKDGKEYIGFADPSWVSSRGSVHFPALGGEDGEAWGSFLFWEFLVRARYWRWLVASK